MTELSVPVPDFVSIQSLDDSAHLPRRPNLSPTRCRAILPGTSPRLAPQSGRAIARFAVAAGDRLDHRRRVLGQPAARRRTGAEDLAGVPVARPGASSADVRVASCRSRRRCCRRSRPRSSGPASTSACGADGEEFFVWGTTREVPAFCLVVEVVASGLIVVKHRIGAVRQVRQRRGARRRSDQDRRRRRRPDRFRIARRWSSSLAGRDRSQVGVGRDRGADPAGGIDAAARPRRRAAGGADRARTRWRESIVTPVLYAVDPPYAELSQLVRMKNADPDDLKRAVDAIAGLTAVDGATIINDRYDLLAFGAKITRRRGSTPVEQVNVTEPVEGSAITARHAGAARRHAAPVGGAVRARSARRDGAGRVAGRPLHDLQVVAARRIRARASRRRAAALVLRTFTSYSRSTSAEHRLLRAATSLPAPAAPSGSAAARSRAAAPCPRSSAGRRDR